MTEYVMGILTGIIIMVLIAMTNPCGAHELNRDECQGLAEDGIRFVFNRRDGVALEDAKAKMFSIVAAHAGTGFMQDEEDTDRIMGLLESVWDLPPEITPGKLFDAVYEGCTKWIGWKKDMPPGIEKSGPQIQG
jgi:hypothetical protein